MDLVPQRTRRWETMNDTRYSLSEKQAHGHIEISLQVKRIVQACCPDCDVYVATYAAGRAGPSYQGIEEQSGVEFWSIKAWTESSRERFNGRRRSTYGAV
jgi:hypothetical protein